MPRAGRKSRSQMCVECGEFGQWLAVYAARIYANQTLFEVLIYKHCCVTKNQADQPNKNDHIFESSFFI